MGTIVPMSLNALSHDLRTPLVGILGMTDCLIREHLTPKQREYVTTILNETGCLLHAVNKLVAASRNEESTAFDVTATDGFDSPDYEIPKYRVLLVEDNPIAQRVHSDMLKRIDCEFDLAADAKQALSMVFDANGQSNYDVILMDIGLGEGMNGFEASDQIRRYENGKKIRIVALSATAHQELKKDCLAAQMDGFVNKPIGIETLRNIVYGVGIS